MSYKTFVIVLILYAVTACHSEEVDSSSSEADNTSKSGTTVTSTAIPSTTKKPENVSCETHSGNCEDCVKHKTCYYCQTDDKCNKYVAKELIPTDECSLDKTRYLTCTLSLKVMIILIGTLCGIVLLVIICVCCYCCCKKKGFKLSKDDLKFARQKEERKARAEERKKERASRTDEIRRKYGLMKDNPYEQFDA